jgi:hypothetical protein
LGYVQIRWSRPLRLLLKRVQHVHDFGEADGVDGTVRLSVMVIDNLEVPEGALKSVDMVVAKFDGARFLLSAIRSVLETKPVTRKAKRPSRARGQARAATPVRVADHALSAHDNNSPFSPEQWKSIL